MRGSRAVVPMDGDQHNDPRDLPRLLATMDGLRRGQPLAEGAQ